MKHFNVSLLSIKKIDFFLAPMLSASFCVSFPEQQHVVTKLHTNITPLSKHSVCNTLKSVITHNMADTRTKNSGALVTEATDVFVS